MKSVHILEDNDEVQVGDYIRPLFLDSVSLESTDHYSVENPYAGALQGHVKWLRVDQALSSRLLGHSVRVINKEIGPHEFLRGTPPSSHLYGDNAKEDRNKFMEALEAKVEYGKYLGRTWRYVFTHDPNYFGWARSKGKTPA